MKIRKAIIPIAGKGTRFLPATKQIAKEIIPIINVPMIHYIVQEAVEAGIEQIIFVTSSGKFSVEDYFDRNQELEAFLERNNKMKELDLIRKIGSMVDVTSVRQKEQLGLGHAVLCAKNMIGDEPFAILLGDDIVINDKPAIKQLMDVSLVNNGAPVIGVMEVPKQDTPKYGIVKGEIVDEKTLRMTGMVEKPKPEDAPTNLATPGRYILTPKIFSILEKIPRGAGNEYQLTDAINVLCQSQDVFAYRFDGERYDTGNVHGYLDATIDFALKDPEIRDTFLASLKSRLVKHGISV
ncbi:UTP--glucose-1-phosphate uridylyltransferase GalU [Peredibacter sp. HCB2-198]|uniref:UTP--glucose-1-phosphate uridylyltransferase GalU n=1 Tax=Peredibacter sp. HCB2-198 TaxID=3383025 RepID=UPI0038B4E6AF